MSLAGAGQPVPGTAMGILMAVVTAGDDLSKRGEERAKCLATHFKSTGITNLYAYTDHPSQRSGPSLHRTIPAQYTSHYGRSVETLTPLSEALHVKIDTKTDRDDTKALAKRISELPTDSVALVCWEHQQLSDIAEALGVHNPPDYNGYDEEWTIVNGELKKGSEGC
jgi:hypothetical protein